MVTLYEQLGGHGSLLQQSVLRFVLAQCDMSTLEGAAAVDTHFRVHCKEIVRCVRAPRATLSGPAMGARSMLLVFMHIPKFRKAVYSMSATLSEPPPFVLALRELFRSLEQGGDAGRVGVDMLLPFLDAEEQQDATSFFFKLLDKMKDSGLEIAEDLFKITCEHIALPTRRRIGKFAFLPLRVHGHSTLYEGLEDFIRVRSQDIGSRRCCFTGLSPVLMFSLDRFRYDEHIRACVKNVDRFEFPSLLDMSQVCPGAGVYKLYAALGHAGQMFEGVFSLFINPLRSSEWYRFSRTDVQQVEYQEATDRLFGGDGHDANDPVANLLVYVRMSDIRDLDCDGANSAFPFTI